MGSGDSPSCYSDPLLFILSRNFWRQKAGITSQLRIKARFWKSTGYTTGCRKHAHWGSTVLMKKCELQKSAGHTYALARTFFGLIGPKLWAQCVSSRYQAFSAYFPTLWYATAIQRKISTHCKGLPPIILYSYQYWFDGFRQTHVHAKVPLIGMCEMLEGLFCT
jgi:hypothetical protein